MLYLHGNNIGRLVEVDKLSGLANLRLLTLHGNPIEVGEREPGAGYKEALSHKQAEPRTVKKRGV